MGGVSKDDYIRRDELEPHYNPSVTRNVYPLYGMSTDEARETIKGLGLTHGDLARLLGVYESTVSRWLSLRRADPVPEYLALILRLLRDVPAARAYVLGRQ